MANVKDTRFTETRRIDALVFIDGVEIPFNWLEVSFVADQPSTATISVEPDPDTDLWRPSSQVHIFVRLPFPDEVPTDDVVLTGRARDEEYDLRTFALYWEGELVSISDDEGAESRQTIIGCADHLVVPQTAQLSMVRVSADLSVPMINGSTYIPAALDDDGSLTDLIISGLITSMFGKDSTGATNTVLVTDVSELGRKLLLFLAPYNASYGLRLLRTQLMNKLASVSDKTIGRFVTQRMAREIIEAAIPQYDAQTVWGLLIGTLSRFFHHVFTVPFPRPAAGEYRMYAIVPNLHYAIPPFCNWLFPDQYQQRSVDRQFLQEPTRLGLKTSLVDTAGDAIHLAPHDLLQQILRGSTSSELFGSQVKAIGSIDNLDERLRNIGFYAVGADGGVNTERNLLKFLTPEELEKGIIYQQDSNDYQALLSRAAVAANTTPDRDPVERKLQTYARQTDSVGTHAYYTRWLAEYQLTLRKLSRTIQVSGPFNPWPVVGFPMLLARQGRSYRGLLVALTSRIDYGGQTQTTYQIEYGMLVRPSVGPEADQAVRRVNQAAEQAVRAVKRAVDVSKLEVAEDSTIEQLEDKLNQSVSAVERVAGSTAYADLRADTALSIAARGAQSGAVLAHRLSVYAHVSAEISTVVEAGSVPAEGTVRARVQGYVNQFGLSGSDKADIGRIQLQRFASSASNAPDARQMLKLLGEAVGQVVSMISLFYQVVRGDVSIGPLVIAGSSPDYAAYQQALRNDWAVTDQIAELIVEYEKLSKEFARLRSQGRYDYYVSTLEGEASRLKEKIADLRLKQSTSSTMFRFDWLGTLETWRQVAADTLSPSLSALSVIELSFETSETRTRRLNELGTPGLATVVPALVPVLLQSMRRLYSAYLTVTNMREPTEAEVLQSLRETQLVTALDRVLLEFLDRTAVVFSPDQQELLDTARRSLAEANATLDDLNKVLLDSELAVPPLFPFSNVDLCRVERFDRTVKDIILAQYDEGTYESRVGQIASAELSRASAFSRSNAAVVARRDAVLAYHSFIRVANGVFPLTDTGEGVTEYQAHKLAGDVHAWANRVQARETVSLGRFIRNNELTLTLESVSSPFGSGHFYRMSSRKFTEGEGVGGFFSRLGSFALTPRGDKSNLTRSLNEIRVAAKSSSAARAILDEESRQQLLLAYARRHAVPAAFQGKR